MHLRGFRPHSLTGKDRDMTVLLVLALLIPVAADAQTTETLLIRGRAQTLRLYGPRDGYPAIVSSGDGGWIHLAPQVAAMLAARGFFVVGFDSKAYLESFTTGATALTVSEVPADYRTLARLAAARSSHRPILIGVSEGAALSVLAATDPEVKALVTGVIGLGLGDANELAWRWQDSLIYLTHGVPNEPRFSTIALAGRVAPTPLAVINATHDEYVPAGEVDRIIAAARQPKRLWMIEAADHRFSGRQSELASRLAEAIDWARTINPK
jgi:type IV secretory pathway VirJ component